MKKWFVGHVKIMTLLLIVSTCHLPLVVLLSISRTFRIEEKDYFYGLLIAACIWSVAIAPFLVDKIGKSFGVEWKSRSYD